MKIRGYIDTTTLGRNYSSGYLTVVMDVAPQDANTFLEHINKYEGKLLDIDITKHREKRSLNANAYFWVLCEKLSEAVGCSKQEIHDRVLADYGCFDLIDGAILQVQLMSSIPPSLLGGAWQKMEQDGDFITWGKLKNTSDMNSKEMSTVINGIVSECRLLNIETLPPDELERMLKEVDECKA